MMMDMVEVLMVIRNMVILKRKNYDTDDDDDGSINVTSTNYRCEAN